MSAAADSLMKVIARSLREPADFLWFTNAAAQFLKVGESPWLQQAALKFATSDSNRKERSWYSFVFSATIHSTVQRSNDPRATDPNQRPITGAGPSRPAWPLLLCDEELGERVVTFHERMKRHQGPGFFDGLRRGIRSLMDRGYLPKDSGLLDLRAVDYLEANLVEIERELKLDDILADLSIVAAVEIFDLWVHRKLKSVGISFRLVLDRLTSTYRLVPPEACGSLDNPNHIELRYVEACTVFSACLIAYLTLPGIDGRVEEWVEAVGLIDRLAFSGVLERFFRCPVCSSWGYAVYTRRDYCSDKCRYRVWMKTPKGLEKRRRASAAWRKRFSEEIRKATPNVGRGKRTR
jgi:hypothetical protein